EQLAGLGHVVLLEVALAGVLERLGGLGQSLGGVLEGALHERLVAVFEAWAVGPAHGFLPGNLPPGVPRHSALVGVGRALCWLLLASRRRAPLGRYRPPLPGWGGLGGGTGLSLPRATDPPLARWRPLSCALLAL